MTKTTTTTIAALSMLLGAGLALLPGETLAQSKEPLKVGALFTTTGGGAQTGIAALIGARMAAKEINDAGGILGRQLVLVQGDDGADPTAAVAETRRMVQQEKVEIMLGPLYSPTAIAAANAVMKTNTQLTYWSFATSVLITPQLGPTLFTYGPNTDAIGDAMADYAVDVRKPKAIAIFSDDVQQSKLQVERIRARLAQRGVPVVAEDQFPANSEDVTPQLLSLRRKGVDFILMPQTFVKDTGTVLKNIDELGWNVDVAGNNGVVISYNVIAKQVGPTAIKRLVAGVGIKPFTACAGDAVGVSPYAQFLVRLKQFAPTLDPSTQVINVIETYDQLYMAKQAAEAVGSTDGVKMTQWLENNSDKTKPIAAYPRLSPTNHFIATSESLTMADNLGETRADGMMRRAGC